MYEHKCKVRVRYADTDKMGFLYYGHYAKFYEIGRVESMRQIGLSYKDMEDELGLLLPVLSLTIRYKQPAYYDDELTIITRLHSIPTKMFTFDHIILNEAESIINTAQVKLFCVEKTTNKRVETPKVLLDGLAPYFKAP